MIMRVKYLILASSLVAHIGCSNSSTKNMLGGDNEPDNQEINIQGLQGRLLPDNSINEVKEQYNTNELIDENIPTQNLQESLMSDNSVNEVKEQYNSDELINENISTQNLQERLVPDNNVNNSALLNDYGQVR